MTRQYFGTDGVRGRANGEKMNAILAMSLGVAVGQYFREHAGEHRVVIGKDTRRSGYMLENALTAGLTSVGMDVFLLGPVPTPAVGILTRNMRADIGVMISASHNPAEDNGIKFFGPDGYKLSDEVELAIEALIENPSPLVDAPAIGMAKRIDSAKGRYMEFAKTAFPRGMTLDGLKIVVDAANGAAYRAAPQILWELGADIVPLGVNPNGYNINKDCGSTHPEAAAKAVIEHGADLGICLDGDADRLILIDEKGHIADGDQLMGLIAEDWISDERLPQNTLVATVMSNLGLERHMASLGGTLVRTAVGDRYVVDEMRAKNYTLGGEQSGHIVMTDYATTGDGTIAALQFLSIMKKCEKPASEILRVFEPVPQKLVNIRYGAGQLPLENVAVKQVIADAEAELNARGRLLIRKSGTEPLIRVMGECDDDGLLDEVLGRVKSEIDKAVS